MVSGDGSCDNSIVHFVGKVRVFFLYSYIIDTFYLLVVNYCCYLVCLKHPRCWASVYTCTSSPTCPPHLGGWWPAVAKKPKIFASFFSPPSDTVLHFWRGKVGISKRLMYCSLSFCSGVSTPLLCSALSGVHNTFLKDKWDFFLFCF